MNKPGQVYQFKITLLRIEPVIWRRIQVPSGYSFWDLHVAIQDAMDWRDYHLHLFRIKGKHKKAFTQIGIPSDDPYEGEPPTLPGWEVNLVAYFQEPGITAQYEYDFGDCWQHEILFEGILMREKGQKYPRCLAGQRACPPEDCGGTGGYERFLQIIGDPSHEEHEDMIRWVGGHYDPEEFSPESVRFDDPKKRCEKAFRSGLR